MIWDEQDQYAMRRIIREIWAEMQIRRAWPRHLTTRWTTAPRGTPVTWPLPRSWLGGRWSDPHNYTHLTH